MNLSRQEANLVINSEKYKLTAKIDNKLLFLKIYPKRGQNSLTNDRYYETILSEQFQTQEIGFNSFKDLLTHLTDQKNLLVNFEEMNLVVQTKIVSGNRQKYVPLSKISLKYKSSSANISMGQIIKNCKQDSHISYAQLKQYICCLAEKCQSLQGLISGNMENGEIRKKEDEQMLKDYLDIHMNKKIGDLQQLTDQKILELRIGFEKIQVSCQEVMEQFKKLQTKALQQLQTLKINVESNYVYTSQELISLSQKIEAYCIQFKQKQYQNGNKYVGMLINGKRYGRGSLILANGDKYQGQWSNDKKQGKGWYYVANGNRMAADFVNDSPHGRAIIYFQNGDKEERIYHFGQIKSKRKI